LGQVEGSQAFFWQAPDAQLWSVEQTTHWLPPPPQAPSVVPSTQRLPWQHPWQFEGPQADGTQRPLWQISPSLHALQAAPPSPQTSALLPVTHFPPSSQQP